MMIDAIKEINIALLIVMRYCGNSDGYPHKTIEKYLKEEVKPKLMLKT